MTTLHSPQQPENNAQAGINGEDARDGVSCESPQTNFQPSVDEPNAVHARRFSDLCQMGFSVLPVDKHKVSVSSWKLRQTERASLEQALEWDGSGHNVGIATGSVSGFFVLDLDSDLAFAEAERRGWLAATPRVKTGRGWHYYYLLPADFEIRNKAALGVPGIDIRAHGGYVVGPGSVHANGHIYRWEPSPTEVAIASAPAPLLEVLKPEPRTQQGHHRRREAPVGNEELSNLIINLAKAEKGHRNQLLNDTAFRLGQLLAPGQLDRLEWEDRLREAARRCGLDDAEIDKTLSRAIDEGICKPRESDFEPAFSINDNGVPHNSIGNALIALEAMGVQVSFDSFANRHVIKGLEGYGPALDDAVLVHTRLLAESRWGLRFGKDRWLDIVTDNARRNTSHPVREYLDGLQWDRTERIDRWLVTYAGAQDSEYVRAVGGLFLVAAVRRVREPGCKFDEMLVLESPQGTNKSEALSCMAVNEDWFSDDLPLNADSKVVMESTAGRWIVELAELKGMRRSDVEHVKALLSRRVDKARMAYGRMTTEQPRQCVFFGTTNNTEYLRDMTGNRRFWPVAMEIMDVKALRRDRDQLWAEAATREARGDSIRLPERLWAAAGAEQAGRVEIDPFFEMLCSRLDGVEGKVRASDVWMIVGLEDKGRRTQDHNSRLSSAMKLLGWTRPKSVLRFDGRPQHAWVKGKRGQSVDAYPEVPRDKLLSETLVL